MAPNLITLDVRTREECRLSPELPVAYSARLHGRVRLAKPLSPRNR